ncbi:MAG: permease [Cyanobacteria bacterium]|nr:permease [Cyanobacteriota bacterium]
MVRPGAAVIAVERLATTWALFQALLVEAMPFLLIGVALSTLARWISPGGKWVRDLPAHPLLGPLSGAALGFALPACECGNVPMARHLLVKGAPIATALGFLFAAPVLNPIVLASTWAAFPDQPWLLAARPLGALLIAVCLATLLRLLPERELLQPALLEERRLSQPLGEVTLLERRSGLIGVPAVAAVPPLGGSSRRPPLGQVLSHGGSEFLELALLLVMGCAIAALVQTVVPRQWLIAVGGTPTLSILSLMLLSLVVSVCSSVDAFLALGFAAQVTPGAVLAFLLLGPVMDLKLVGLFGILLRPRAILLTAGAASLVVLLIGQWVNLLLL